MVSRQLLCEVKAMQTQLFCHGAYGFMPFAYATERTHFCMPNKENSKAKLSYFF